MFTPRMNSRKPPLSSKLVRMVPSELFFGAAVQAQMQNGDYIKDGYTNQKLNRCNTAIIRDLLMNPSKITPENLAQGRELQTHYQSLVFKKISGEIQENTFLDAALRLASEETINFFDHKAISVIAALPQSYAQFAERERQQELIAAALQNSQVVGKIGDIVRGDFKVLNCFYSRKYFGYFTNVMKDNNVYFFPVNTNLKQNTILKMQGTIRGHRDRTTLLTNVRFFT